MILGTLRTRILEDHDIKQGGYFDLPVTIDEATMQRTGDPKSYAHTIIAAHLSSAIRDTGVPQEYWTFEFEARPRRKYNFPELLNFGVSG